jgi:hypothetical protein
MKTMTHIGNTLLAALLACGLVGCGSSETNNGTGGSGSGAGSTTTPSGGSGGGAGGTTTSSSGGGGGTTTASGGSTGGSGSTTTPSGGSGGSSSTSTASTDGKLCPTPQALITDFTYTPGSGTTQVHFGNSTTLGGGEYVYGGLTDAPLVSDMSNSNWHITGSVGDYSGFGLYFDNCSRIDASAFKGISFKISSTVISDGITFGVDTLDNTITADWINVHGGNSTGPGRCTPPADSSLNQYSQSTCANATASIPVTATPTVQQVLWSDFTGGKPNANIEKPGEIIGIHWNFTWNGAGTPYEVDLTLDELSFIP